MQDSRLTAVQEVRPLPGDEKLSITDYHSALVCVTCFGSRSQFAAVASVPEEAYKTPAAGFEGSSRGGGREPLAVAV